MLLHYSDPGKPWHNVSRENFNDTFRRGCLNGYEFHTLARAKVFIEEWRRIHNMIRPHNRLGYRPPASGLFSGTVSGGITMRFLSVRVVRRIGASHTRLTAICYSFFMIIRHISGLGVDSKSS